VLTKSNIAICAIVKNEEHYIEEWIAFHLVQGVKKFLIVDNGQSTLLRIILQPYISAGVVELFNFPSTREPQLTAYALALKKIKEAKQFEWVAFIDADEFLFSPLGKKLPRVLAKYSNSPAVVVNWVSFGSSGQMKRPNELAIEAFTMRGPLNHQVPYSHLRIGINNDGSPSYRPINSHIKSIIRPSRTKEVGSNPHEFRYIDNAKAVNELGIKQTGPWSEPIQIDMLRINHYWSRSLEDMKLKAERGRAASVSKRTWEEMVMRDSLCTGVVDKTIIKFVPRVKSVMKYYESKRDDSVMPQVQDLVQ
jgi:glycosyltransferase involved in cell wall biosynthesis